MEPAEHKAKAREVHARYLQARAPTAAGARPQQQQARGGAPGRGGGAGAWASAGALALPAGAAPACLDAQLGEPATAKRQPQQRQPKARGSGPGDTAPLADASALGRRPAPRLAVGAAVGPASGSLISPGSERSPGGSGSDGGGGDESDGSLDLLQPARQHAGARGTAAAASQQQQQQQQQQPRMGVSTDTGMAAIADAAAGAAPCAAAAERRRQLEEFRQQRAAAAAAKQEHAARPDPAGGVFKQPAPRPPGSVFRATAAMLEAPTSARRGGGTWHSSSSSSSGATATATRAGSSSVGSAAAGPGAGGARPQQSLPSPPLAIEASYASSTGSASSSRSAPRSTAAQRQAPGSGGAATGCGGGGAGGLTLSAFKATMATLQQSKSAASAAAPGSGKGLRVPKLPLDALQGAPAPSAGQPLAGRQLPPPTQQAQQQQQQQQQQQAHAGRSAATAAASAAPAVGSSTPRGLPAGSRETRRLSLPGNLTPRSKAAPPASASRIPRASSSDLASAAVGHAAALPLADEGLRARAWEAAQVALPDGTPRSLGTWRDAPAPRRPSQLPRTPSAGLPMGASDGGGGAGSSALTPPLMRRWSAAGTHASSRGDVATAAAAAAALHTGAGGAASPRGSSVLGRMPSAPGSVPASPPAQLSGQPAKPPTPAASARTPRGVPTGLTPRRQSAGHATPREQLTPRRGAGPLTPRSGQPQAQASKPPPPQQHGQTASAAAAAAEGRPLSEEAAAALREEVRLLRVRELQWRYIRAKAAAAREARRAKGEQALSCVAAAVMDLRGSVAVLQAVSEAAGWDAAAATALGRQLPLLHAWQEREAAHARALSSVQASLRAALSRLPLVNGAVVGHDSAAPSLGALQGVLQRGCEAVERVRPALARLMGPSQAAEREAGAQAGEGRGEEGGVAVTAGYARQLIDVACEEVCRLGAIKARLELLADAALYAASMQAQLAAAGGGGAAASAAAEAGAGRVVTAG
ncbi:hypothetical protein Rsub_09866 [Raphidocelis subcapitata]|uniref:Uncharacterized protein n=1 Tax=Raphidocelis subcapitata TaxID=307507 RepID=A0A2V0P9J2_9CHLO|nr:hypothetical protein Rsub_09866 [Raphidocelis subcapitata]|eukprot:GBF96524.1 hypothetical protein Rsub_09866 [Raphidocelis subcapitata]